MLTLCSFEENQLITADWFGAFVLAKKGKFQIFPSSHELWAAFAVQWKGGGSEGQLCVKLIELGICS